MAMTKCKECGNEISTKADACPKCGAKQVRTSGCAKFALVILILLVILPFIGKMGGEPTPSPTSTPTATKSPATKPPNPGDQWIYGQNQDPMSKGISYGASVKSTNTVEFGFPYAGKQHATLTLRTHPRYGKDLIFSIERGQLLCRSYEDCTILVRFDEQPAQNYSAVGPADNSSDTIFIRNYSRFIASMLKSSKVRISVPVYQHGSPVFEFNVSGFEEKKYKPVK